MLPAIRVEGVGKKYTIRHEGRPQYRMIREEISNRIRLFARRFGSNPNGGTVPAKEEFWALRGIDFEIEQGDRVGIIGRNGAGKSTLLKLLSRITEPSTGRISLRGRVGSLLEVGTGFHPEMTGRENIFLNGAVLGMKRSEIRRRFDEIVAFAGVERFLDTPVKRYSSGMYVRLAFSVAAHLEPEILIVDEVLAVGDYEFQKKCLGKMETVSRSDGRTVLFVSHNMAAIESLCNRVMLLKGGSIVADSTDVGSVIDLYQSKPVEEETHAQWHNRNTKYSSEYFSPLYFGLVDEDGRSINRPVRNDEVFQICIDFVCNTFDSSLVIGYIVYDPQGNTVFISSNTDSRPEEWACATIGPNRLISEFPRRFLNEGTYSIKLVASLYSRQWLISPESEGPIIHFSIQGGLSDSPQWLTRRAGIAAPVIHWKTANSPNK